MEGMRLGVVSAIEKDTGMVQVIFVDTGDASDYLPYLTYGKEYYPPRINSMVLVAGLASESGNHVVLGGFWNKVDVPPISENTDWKKIISNNAHFEYSDDTLFIKAPNIIFDVDGKKINLLEILGGEANG